MQGKIVASRFYIAHKIGSGSFGDIHIAIDLQTRDEIAVKFEKTDSLHPMLLNEASLTKSIYGGKGIPKILYANVEGEYNVMAMQLLGPSLEDLFNFCGR